MLGKKAESTGDGEGDCGPPQFLTCRQRRADQILWTDLQRRTNMLAAGDTAIVNWCLSLSVRGSECPRLPFVPRTDAS